MKNFVVESGDFITTSGIYRINGKRPSDQNDHPGREITLIYGDAVPTFQGKKVTPSAHPRCEESQARLRRWNPDHVRSRRKQTNGC
jgi:hypothetical protein